MNKYYDTKIDGFKIRYADESDVSLILKFIRDLADYEGLLHEVVATEEILMESLFKKRQAEVVIGEYEGKPAGFALYFHNFSTFLGKANLYLEDLYVDPDFRGKGLGKTMLACLGNIAVERGCGRLDWWCLDWNKSSIDFYIQMGAKPMDEWTVYRVDGDNLQKLAEMM